MGNWQGAGEKNKGGSVLFTKTGKVEFTHPGTSTNGELETAFGNYSFKKDAVLQLDKAGSLSNDWGWQVEVEFLTDDEVLFVNHGHPYGGFGPLAGRFKRAK